MNDFTKELYHHGIRKQRWGVRNGPPYPLGQKVHNRIVKGKQDKELKKYSEAKSGRTQYPIRGEQSYYSLIRESRDDSEIRQQPTDYITDDYMRSIKTLSNRGSINSDWLDLKSDIHVVNPNYSNDRDEGVWRAANNNCVKCSSTLALRAMGYDVIAGLAPSGMENNATQKYWDGARPYKEKGADNLERRMLSFGKRGMGELIMRYSNGGGHSIFFQNERQSDGTYKPKLCDGQTGRTYASVQDAINRLGFDTTQFGQITRLDDAMPNFKSMAEDSVFVPRKGRYVFGDEDRKRVAWDA